MIKLALGYKDKYCGFLVSIDYVSVLRVCVLLGIFKKPHWKYNKGKLCLGYLYISFTNIAWYIKHSFKQCIKK